MSKRTPRAGRPEPARILLVVFVLALAGSLALVAVDLIVSRAAGGDVFIAGLNSFVVLMLWRRLAEQNNRHETA